MQWSEVDLGGFTIAGRQGELNQDAWTAFSIDAAQEWTAGAVADGVGGAPSGDAASARAMETIRRELQTARIHEPSDHLARAIERANDAIWNEGLGDAAKRGMACTIVCALVARGRAAIANVGDSRAILVSASEVRQITRDHSVVAELVRWGDVKPSAAAEHPFRNVLSRCLGGGRNVEVQVYPPIHLGESDALVLCTDGMWTHVGLDDMAAITRESKSAADAARTLVQLADSRSGGLENVTALIMRMDARR
jgi:serine/threonine protein phosphatase PrpC